MHSICEAHRGQNQRSTWQNARKTARDLGRQGLGRVGNRLAQRRARSGQDRSGRSRVRRRPIGSQALGSQVDLRGDAPRPSGSRRKGRSNQHALRAYVEWEPGATMFQRRIPRNVLASLLARWVWDRCGWRSSLTSVGTSERATTSTTSHPSTAKFSQRAAPTSRASRPRKTHQNARMSPRSE